MKIRKYIFVIMLTLILIILPVYSVTLASSSTSALGIVSTANTINSPSTSELNHNSVSNMSALDDASSLDVDVYADSATLLDVNTGKVLYSKNSAERMYPASTTKLLTAIVVTERCSDLSAKAKVSYYAVHSVPYTYSIANLYANEEFSLRDLLHSLLIASANDSAFVLAEYVANGGNNYSTDSSADAKSKFTSSISVFSEMMNSKAKEIGAINSNFVNPNGIHNENHYSTANDLALIGKYAYNSPIIMKIVGTIEYATPATDLHSEDNRHYKSTNLLLRKDRKFYYEYANGLKTGYTDAAQYCIIASAKKDERSLICVILHSGNANDSVTSREMDCIRLFDYGFTKYSLSTLSSSGSVSRTLKILNGTKETSDLDVVCKDDLKALIKTGEAIDVTPDVKITKFLAPISKGEVVGTIKYTVDGISYSSDLIAEHDVYSSSYTNFIWILAIAFVFLTLIFILISKKPSRKNKNLRFKNNHSPKYQKRSSGNLKTNRNYSRNYSKGYNKSIKVSLKHNANNRKKNSKQNKSTEFNHNKYML